MFDVQAAKAEPFAKGVGVGQASSSRSTLHTVIEDAKDVGGRLDEFGQRLGSLAEHAQSLASRIAGPYPSEASGAGQTGRSTDDARRAAQSTVEAITLAVNDLHPAVSRFDPAVAQIVRALEMIERAVG